MECHSRRSLIPFQTLSQSKNTVSRASPGFQGTKEALEDVRDFYKRTTGGHIRICLRGTSFQQEGQENGEKVDLVNFVILAMHSIFVRVGNIIPNKALT